MLSYREALDRILSQVPPTRARQVQLDEALGSVLAEPVYADVDIPPFNKSFMDGFAVDSRDLSEVPRDLEIVATSAAGRSPDLSLKRGQAVRIMTGAPVPTGADAVQMVEKTEELSPNRVRILEPVKAGQHVAPRASEVSAGRQVLEVGTHLTPAEIAVLAMFGKSAVSVFAGLRVTIMATGDELVDVATSPAPGQIRNSNSHMLAAQCRGLGLSVSQAPPVSDDPEKIRQAIRSGLKESDLLIFSGGVSMGEFDHVHTSLQEEGVDIFFHKAAVKPGKPIIVGRLDNKLVFGLPGNPVSSLVTFQIFVAPAVSKWTGRGSRQPFLLSAELMETFRQKPGRLFFAPAATVSTPVGLQTRPVPTKGSADIVAFSRANSLLLVGADVEELAAGSSVAVLPLGGCPGIKAIGFEL